MRKTSLFAFAAAALILAGVGGWVASTPQESVAAERIVQMLGVCEAIVTETASRC